MLGYESMKWKPLSRYVANVVRYSDETFIYITFYMFVVVNNCTIEIMLRNKRVLRVLKCVFIFEFLLKLSICQSSWQNVDIRVRAVTVYT